MVSLNCLLFHTSVSAGFMYLEICPFLLSSLIYWYTSACSILLWMFFQPLWYPLFSSFHFLFCLRPLFFSSWWTWLKVYQFCLSFKIKTTLGFIDLLLFLFCSLFHSFYNVYCLLSPAAFVLCLFFFFPLGGRLGYFSYFMGMAFTTISFLLRTAFFWIP